MLRTTPWVTTFILYSRSLFWTQTLSTEGIQKAWVSGNGGPHGRVPTPPAGHEDGAMAGPQGGRRCGWGSSPGTSPGPGCRLAARLAVSRAPPLLVAGAKAGSRRPISAGRAMSGWLTTAPSQLPVAGTPRPDALCVTPWDKPELPAAGLSLPLLAEPFGKAGRSIRVQAWPSASDRVWVDRQRAPCRGAPPAPRLSSVPVDNGLTMCLLLLPFLVSVPDAPPRLSWGHLSGMQPGLGFVPRVGF